MKMQPMPSFTPNNHKSVRRRLIYGPILTIQSSTESLTSSQSCEGWLGSWLNDIKSWYIDIMINDPKSTYGIVQFGSNFISHKLRGGQRVYSLYYSSIYLFFLSQLNISHIQVLTSFLLGLCSLERSWPSFSKRKGENDNLYTYYHYLILKKNSQDL